jgi:prevent-host-death family protein
MAGSQSDGLEQKKFDQNNGRFILWRMITKQISVSEFKAHCTEEIRAVEKGDTILELTRHGKKVAVVKSPALTSPTLDLGGWIGSGKGTVAFAPGYDTEAPAWDPGDWES